MAARKTNWFAIWVSVAVVAVIAIVGGIVVFSNMQAGQPAEAPEAGNVETDTGAIVFGDGGDVVETYIDFMCPYCNQFEQEEGPEIQRLIDSGEITLKVHPLGVLDRASQGTRFSSRSAAAMYAVAADDPAHAYAFLQAMFENQPSEGTPGLTDDEILAIARDAGVDVTPELEASITSQEYVGYVEEQSLPEGARGTPTLGVNDEIVPVTYDPQADIVARLG